VTTKKAPPERGQEMEMGMKWLAGSAVVAGVVWVALKSVQARNRNQVARRGDQSISFSDLVEKGFAVSSS
jgi:hypothetical protein